MSTLEIQNSTIPQATLGDEFQLRGIGIFSGRNVGFVAKPADPDTGIIFKLGKILIPARIEYVEDVPNRTRLRKDGVMIQVVEHLVSALRGLGVDNAIIEPDSDELPILDASAKDYVELILKCGLVKQSEIKTILVVNEPVYEIENGMLLALLPDSSSRVTYFLDHLHPQIGKMADSLELTAENYRDFIGPARTFATREEAEYMIKNKIVGTDDENLAIVIGTDGPNAQLRHPLEYVHHKMLDMIGDLSLASWPIRGHILGVKSGHGMNRKLARKIAELLREASEKGNLNVIP